MNLIRAEVRRLFKRRITRYCLLLIVLVYLAIAGSVVLNSQHIGASERAAAQAQATQEEIRARKNADEERAACERAHETGTEKERFPSQVNCADFVGPPPGTYEVDWYLPYEFDFRKEFGPMIAVFSGILALFAFIVGASYVGAEWHSGGMMNLLLWRPKRLTVLFTKLGVLLGGVLTIGLAVGAMWTAGFWLIARYDGRLENLTAGVWQSFALDGARGLGLVLIAGAGACALASIGRHTAMAMGVAVVVGVVSEIGLRILLTITGVAFGDRYILSTYVMSWFMKKYTLFNYNSCKFVQGSCEPEQLILTWQDSAWVFGAGTALVLGAAVWLMRRRDIT